MQRSFALAFLLPCLSSLALAGTITVGPAGSGADHPLLGDALAAAMPGDTILVLPGLYEETAATIVEKPLTILGAGSDVTELKLFAAPLFGSDPLVIRNTPAHAPTRFVGIGIVLTDSHAATNAAVQVTDCQGPVLLQDVVRVASPTAPERRLDLRIGGSPQVVLERCVFEGQSRHSNCLDPAVPASPAVEVLDSTVFVHASSLLGGVTLDTCFNYPGVGGLELYDSVGHVSDSLLEGSSGAASLSGGTLGHPAVELFGAAALTLFGATTVQGGHGGVPPLSSSWTLGAPAIELKPGQPVTATPDVTFLPGVDAGGGTSSPAVVDPTGSLETLPERRTTTTTSAALAAPGDAFTIDSAGEPGAVVWTFFGPETAAYPIPGVLGLGLLAHGSLAPLASVVLDAAGAAGFGVTVPPGIPTTGVSFTVQSVGVSPSGTLSFSNPTYLGLLP